MIRLAKRALRAMPVKTETLVRKLELMKSEAEVKRFLVKHKYYGILEKLFGEQTDMIIETYNPEVESEKEEEELRKLFERDGDPAKAFGLTETYDYEEECRKFINNMQISF